MSIVETVPAPLSRGISVSSTGGEGRYVSVPLSGAQRQLSLEAIRIFSRRAAYAHEKGVLSHSLQVPEVSGKILRVPNDPEAIKMFVVSLRILLLQDHQNGLTQAVEGLVHRLTKASLKEQIGVQGVV